MCQLKKVRHGATQRGGQRGNLLQPQACGGPQSTIGTKMIKLTPLLGSGAADNFADGPQNLSGWTWLVMFLCWTVMFLCCQTSYLDDKDKPQTLKLQNLT